MTKRISEADIRITALEMLDEQVNGFLSTADLEIRLGEYYRPTGEDAEILADRNDTKFSQKVRNLVSHKDSSTSLESNGFAIYDSLRHGWQITEKGRSFVHRA